MTSSIETLPETVPDSAPVELPEEPGDHDKFAHYVEKEKLADAMIFGTSLVALCGKSWVPTRDGLKFPVCPECREVWESLRDE